MEAGSHSFSSPFSAAALTAEGRAGRRPNISHHMNPARWNTLPVKVWIHIMKRDLAQLGRSWSLNQEKNYKFTAKASAGWQNAFHWLIGVGIVNRVKTSMVRMVAWVLFQVQGHNNNTWDNGLQWVYYSDKPIQEWHIILDLCRDIFSRSSLIMLVKVSFTKDSHNLGLYNHFPSSLWLLKEHFAQNWKFCHFYSPLLHHVPSPYKCPL